MDIRSSEAVQLRTAFERARIRLTPEGFENIDTHALYAKTNMGRFVRYDQELDQYNILSTSRKAFLLVEGLRPHEHIVRRNFGQQDLLPDRTMWENVKDNFFPMLGLSAHYAVITFFANHVVQLVPAVYGTLVGQSSNWLSNHPSAQETLHRLTSRRVTHAVAGAGTAGAVATAGASTRLRLNSTVLQNDDFPDTSLDFATEQRLQEEAHQREVQRRVARAQLCIENPNDCPPQAGRFDATGDFVAGAVTGILGKMVFDSLPSNEDLERRQSQECRERQERQERQGHRENRDRRF